MNQSLDHLNPSSRTARIRALSLGGVLLVVLLGISYYVYVIRHPQKDGDDVAVVVTTTLSPTGTPAVTEVPTITPTPSPTVSPSPSPTVDVPSSVSAFVANFYAGYEAKDLKRLEAAFTPDTDPTIQDLRSRLFTGAGTDGVAGGPTIFSSSTLQEQVANYTLTAAAQKAKNWVLTIKEERVSGEGNKLPDRTTLITLTPADASSGGWLIDAYSHSGSTGKYNGFFTE